MNRHRNDHDEREWQAQERALGEVRAGVQASADDITLAQYRDIAKALRQPPQSGLPPDFAASVARLAHQLPASAEHARSKLARSELALVRALVAIFALSALVALGVYGDRLLAMLQAAAGAAGLQWSLALTACVALSWSLDWLRRRGGGSEHDGGGRMHRPA